VRQRLELKRAQLTLESSSSCWRREQTEVLRWWQRASIAVLTSVDEGMPVS